MRRLILTAAAIVVITASTLGLSACGSTTPSQAAATAATDLSAGAAAAPTFAALVTDVQGIVADGQLTGTALTSAQADLTQLQAIAATVTPASTAGDLTGALSQVTTVLGDIGQYLPDVLPLLALVDNDDYQLMIVRVADAPKHSDPAKIAALKAHLQALKAIAKAAKPATS